MLGNLFKTRANLVLLVALACSFQASLPALAGEADVIAVTHTRAADGTYRFDVAVRHADAGWEHYADKWQVIGPDGAVLGERVVEHARARCRAGVAGVGGLRREPGAR